MKDQIALLQDITAFLEKDRATLMPPGGSAERERVLATLRVLIESKTSERALAPVTDYATLKERVAFIGNIGKANGLLQWYRDTERDGGLDDHIAALEMIAHELVTSDAVAAGIEMAEKTGIDDAWDRRNLFLIKKNHSLAKAVPEKLVGDLAKAAGECNAVWPKAKDDNDFDAVREPLRRLVDLAVQQAQYYGDALGCDPYDAQLKLYAQGNSQKLIDPVFAELARELPPLVRQIVAKQQAEQSTKGPVKKFTVNPQHVEKMNYDLAARLGFDFHYGRLDTSPHPFSGGTTYDTRMTTAYHLENGVIDSLYSTIHETGHSNYRAPDAWENQPVGALNDMTLHESQSMILERSVGGHEGFLAYLYEFIGQYDPDFPKQGTVDAFIRSMRVVTPSLIRIEADGVTYGLHPIFRYEIEKMLFSKQATVDDIPDLWNAKVKESLGLDVPSNRQGCLQDVHWHCGLYGYFPTYTQGTLYQAQLFAAAKREIGDLDAQLRQGDVSALNAWSKENIHRWGQFLDAGDLMKQATGDYPSAKPFLYQSRKRYLS